MCGNYRGRGDKFVEIIGGEGTNVWKFINHTIKVISRVEGDK